MIARFLKKFHCSRCHFRQNSNTNKIKECDFFQRDIVSPGQLTSFEIKNLIWTAAETKIIKRPSSYLTPKHITLAFGQPSAKLQIAFERGINDLGGDYSLYNGKLGLAHEISGCGRLLSSLTDAVVTTGLSQSEVQELADEVTGPVINASSDTFSTIVALAHMLTFLEVIGPLAHRTIAWLGPPTPLCNAYLCIAPKLRLNLRVFFNTVGCQNVSASMLQKSFCLSPGTTDLHECCSAEEAVYRADIIIVSKHSQPETRITLKLLEEAALDWYFVHALPRTQIEVDDHVFRHKNNLSWKCSSNLRFIASAVLLRTLVPYVLTTTMPDFDGPP